MSNNRWLLLVLAISLIVNLTLVGFIAGRLSGGERRPPLMDPLRSMGRVMAQLPEERRELLQPALRAHLHGMRAGMREVRNSQRQLNEALTDEALDADTLRNALQTFHNSLCHSMQQGHDSFIELALSMTPEERALLMQPPRPPQRPEP